jgi:hypothetical protein
MKNDDFDFDDRSTSNPEWWDVGVLEEEDQRSEVNNCVFFSTHS